MQVQGRTLAPPPSQDPSQRTPPKGVTKKGLLAALGPGLITGASDDDPSGIATYSQVGAQFGFGMLWTMLFSYPLMAGIQEISALIGRVTGRGIAGNIRRHYPAWLLYGIVALMLGANVINIGADIGAMGAAASLLIPGPALAFAAFFVLASLALQIIAPYDRYTLVLKWLTLALFAYVATVFVVHVPWEPALRATVLPSFPWKTAGFLTGIVAVLGTTISPYLFFWQAEQEVEIEKANPKDRPLIRAPRQAPAQMQRIRVDTYVGMAFSNLVAFFIILTAAATLHAHGLTDVQTSTDAAAALQPLAGRFAFLLFALGIIGTGLLAIPVLAGSAAYAVGEALRWPVGLNRDMMQAKGFYGVLAAATLIGLALNVHVGHFHIDPIKALFWSAVINGVVAGPIMIIMMLMASSGRVMGRFTITGRQKFFGWLATAAMLAAAVGLFATWGK
ncbi:MAG: divalent metal cation transporter [Armatimonadetes bacterium]|nr:divalent metal cation transporter [Armatimonadota bacterium]